MRAHRTGHGPARVRGEVPACGHLPLPVSPAAVLRPPGPARRPPAAVPVRGYAGAAIGLTPARSWRVTRIVAIVTISASSAIPAETRYPCEKP